MAVRKIVHTADELRTVLEELDKQTDRGAAIIGASIVEELLAVVIQLRLLPLNSDLRRTIFERSGAPLSSFSAKIDLGYALGLYSESAKDQLHILRECRNKFAHRIEALNFAHPDIVKILGGLDEEVYKAQKNNRDRFLLVVRILAMIFIAQCYAADKIRISELGQTHPEIFVRLLQHLFPEKASALQELLQQMSQPQA